MTREPRQWMWANALDMLARAEQLHQQMFQLRPSQLPRPAWEPPVDVLETEREVLIIAALPGVSENEVELVIDNGCLQIAGTRTLPPELMTASIHRLELPQGRFERRVPLPPGRYDQVRRQSLNGCLVISLRKTV